MTVEGGTIYCDLPDPTPAEADQALDVLRGHKGEALALLAASSRPPEPAPADTERHSTPWPPKSLAAERKFGVPSARLYPFLDHVVMTPEGPAKLLQVFKRYVRVHFNGEHKTRQFRPEQIVIPAD